MMVNCLKTKINVISEKLKLNKTGIQMAD